MQNPGPAILARIVQREQDNLKLNFLSALSTSPLFDELIFRGASALHGVYLHMRYSEDLDFFASPELAAEFVAAFCAAGLDLEARTNAVPVYASRGAVYQRVELSVDVIAMRYQEERFLVPQIAFFHAITGATVPVRTYSLPALLARKLRYVVWRQFAVDFYDLWIGLEKHPECAPEMQEIVRRREIGVMETERYQAGAALARLDGLEATWQEELYALMPRVPEFRQVQRDLRHWLPIFENAERHAL